ncbi:hypothetical protein HK096_008823, partial [Nowakowskiella sp. JEL0078]
MDTGLVLGLKAGLDKLQKYYDKAYIVSNIATILDPQKNIRFYKQVNWERNWLNDLKASLSDAFTVYRSKVTTISQLAMHPKSNQGGEFGSSLKKFSEQFIPATEDETETELQ